MPLTTWLERLPKAELHLHLEGAIPIATLWELIQKYGGDQSVPSQEALRERFVYRDFPHFIQTWIWMCGFLRSYEDFTFIAEAVARDLARQNIRYAEVFCSPGDVGRHGLHTQPLIEAIHRGLARVPEVEIALVPDLVRDRGPEHGARHLAELNEMRDYGVIGIGIGGSEQSYPPEPFAAVYAEARRLGLRTSVHAGEAAGAASVWGAVRTLKADRIGHGTRAIEDAALVEYLAEQQIPIELCPISNVCTAVVPHLAAHPARHYYERGLLVTINTDDPTLFGNSLASEYQALIEQLGFSAADIETLILNAVRASWLPEQRKQQMLAEFQAEQALLAGEL